MPSEQLLSTASLMAPLAAFFLPPALLDSRPSSTARQADACSALKAPGLAELAGVELRAEVASGKGVPKMAGSSSLTQAAMPAPGSSLHTAAG